MITNNEMILRLLIGALLGGLIGLERQTHGRPAGLRTHILVCTASVLVMIVSRYSQALVNPALVQFDPSRLAAGAITGVGFLGAGVIIKSGVTVQGLTTAASIWIMAVIGMAIGSGLYIPAVMAFCITLLTLWTLRFIESKIVGHTYKVITVFFRGEGDDEAVVNLLISRGASIEGRDYEWDAEQRESVMHLSIGFKGKPPLKPYLDGLAAIPNVKKVLIKN